MTCFFGVFFAVLLFGSMNGKVGLSFVTCLHQIVCYAELNNYGKLSLKTVYKRSRHFQGQHCISQVINEAYSVVKL